MRKEEKAQAEFESIRVMSVMFSLLWYFKRGIFFCFPLMTLLPSNLEASALRHLCMETNGLHITTARSSQFPQRPIRRNYQVQYDLGTGATPAVLDLLGSAFAFNAYSYDKKFELIITRSERQSTPKRQSFSWGAAFIPRRRDWEPLYEHQSRSYIEPFYYRCIYRYLYQNLGRFLHDIPTAKSPEKVLELLCRKSKSTDAEMHNFLGLIYAQRHPRELEKAKAEFFLASEQGYAPAQYNLGVIDEYVWQNSEIKEIRQDLHSAGDWFLQSASHNYAPAQFAVSEMYRFGWREPGIRSNHDEKRRLEWLTLAATQGYAPAKHSLGHIYISHKSPEDQLQAIRYFEDAAAQGAAWALVNLGNCYEKGIGVEQDSDAASSFYGEACKLGLLGNWGYKISNFLRKLGYVRMNKPDQKLDIQIEALIKAGCQREDIFVDKVSDTGKASPNWDKCLQTLKHGDTLIVWRLDHFARSVPHLASTLETLDSQGISFKSLCDRAIDKSIVSRELMFSIYFSLAQLEHRLLPKRASSSSRNMQDKSN